MITDRIAQLPEMPEWQKRVQIDHIHTSAVLFLCEQWGIKSLGQLVADRCGRLFCSTEMLAPCPEVYRQARAVSVWAPPWQAPYRVEFHYSTAHVASDTLRELLHTGGTVSVIAEFYSATGNVLVFHPLVMGNPWLVQDEGEDDFGAMWFGRTYYEQFVEDFDEFARVREVDTPSDSEPMRCVTERAFKACLQKLLGGTAQADWGGEQSDFFSSHMHLGGRRKTAAFLLKGPSRFAPMGLDHLGKNNDQIVRLAHEPAEVLVVQHCHDILQPVRETLRAFAVQPSRPRRYCLIDGRDSLRLLRAYDLYDWAVEPSRSQPDTQTPTPGEE
jgi:hypothetical protein